MGIRWVWIVPVLVIGMVLAIVLWPSRGGDLRRFDPAAVARAETGMWRSYYNHHRVLLFRQVSGLLREQYGMSWFRSQMTAYHAARAAVVFQRGHGRSEYERALPDLVSYYAGIRAESNAGFDVQEAALRELEWWIIHRERNRYGADALVRSLADLQSCLYQMPADKFQEHAKARAGAMILRDDRAAQGAVTAADWTRIGQLLDQSWVSLWRAVQR